MGTSLIQSRKTLFLRAALRIEVARLPIGVDEFRHSVNPFDAFPEQTSGLSRPDLGFFPNRFLLNMLAAIIWELRSQSRQNGRIQQPSTSGLFLYGPILSSELCEVLPRVALFSGSG